MSWLLPALSVTVHVTLRKHSESKVHRLEPQTPLAA